MVIEAVYVLASGATAGTGPNWTNISATVAVIFLVYTIAKIGGKFLNNWWEDRKLQRMKEKAKLEAEAEAKPPPGYVPATTPARGLPILGGGNPVVDEISSVIPEGKLPVTNEMCNARQRIITTKMDSVQQDVKGMRSDLADTNRSINKTLLKMTEQVNATNTCVAVLKDRANRDG